MNPGYGVINPFGSIREYRRELYNYEDICEYIDGEIKTSKESLEVKWVSREDARNIVTFTLTKKRLENMLDYSGEKYCFAFRREPFEVVEDDWF